MKIEVTVTWDEVQVAVATWLKAVHQIDCDHKQITDVGDGLYSVRLTLPAKK